MSEPCDLCGDVSASMFLHARCHPTAPLLARKDGDELTLSCYLPACGREVVKLRLAPPLLPAGGPRAVIDLGDVRYDSGPNLTREEVIRFARAFLDAQTKA